MILWAWGVAMAADTEIRVLEREDGDGLAGASVRVLPDGAPLRADERGRLHLPLDGPGPWTVEIVAEGRQTARLEVVEPKATQRVWMVPGAAALEIVVEGLRETADPSRHVVDGEQAMETPGTLDDAIRLVQALPGMTVQREYSPSSGDLSVRGSQPGDSRYYLDGFEIPYLYHFNQYASVFPASQVGSLELFPSTFSARYGDAVGAVVEARSRLEVPEAVHGSAHVNFVMAGADLQVPIGRGWWASAAGRRSYQDLAGEQTPQFTVWPSFHDFVVRAEHGDANRGTGLFAIGAGDSYTRAVGELDVLDPFEATRTPSLAYAEGFQAGGIRHQWAAGGHSGRAVLAAVHHRRRASLSTAGAEDLRELRLSSRTDATWREVDGPWGVDLGYEWNASRTALAVQPGRVEALRVYEEAPALARGVAIDDVVLRMRGGVYSTAYLKTGPVRWMPGLRLGADSTMAAIQLDPRLGIRWRVAEQTMLKLGGGRYTQRPRSEDLLGSDGLRSLPTTRSWQASAGWEQSIAGRLEIGADAYVKINAEPLLFPLDALPRAVETGDAWGLELLTRYRLRERFFLWGWVALQQTRLTEESGIVVPADGDQRVSGGLVASWDLGHWNFGARYRFASGLPFTPIAGSVYDGTTDQWIPVPGALNGARLPPYHKLDLRAAYTWALRGWSLQLVLEVWYVPAAATPLYPTWNFDYTEQDWVRGPGFLPLAGLRARF